MHKASQSKSKSKSKPQTQSASKSKSRYAAIVCLSELHPKGFSQSVNWKGNTMNKMQEVFNLWNSPDKKIRDMSHCKGFGRWEDPQTWSSRLGAFMVKRLLHLMDIFDVDLCDPQKVIDFGCGGGSNLNAMYCSLIGDVSSELCGIDISVNNLVEARKQLSPDVHLVHYDPNAPEVLLEDLPFQEADVFISTYVFQHFPSEDYTKEVINLMTNMVKVGGLFLIQFRHSEGKTTRFSPLPYAADYIRASAMHPDDFRTWLKEDGFEVIYEERQPSQKDYMWFGGRRVV